jgi:hypothetical protein
MRPRRQYFDLNQTLYIRQIGASMARYLMSSRRFRRFERKAKR